MSGATYFTGDKPTADLRIVMVPFIHLHPSDGDRLPACDPECLLDRPDIPDSFVAEVLDFHATSLTAQAWWEWLSCEVIDKLLTPTCHS